MYQKYVKGVDPTFTSIFIYYVICHAACEIFMLMTAFRTIQNTEVLIYYFDATAVFLAFLVFDDFNPKFHFLNTLYI